MDTGFCTNETHTISTSGEMAGKLQTKVSKLRELSLKCDWTKDKRMLAGSTTYPYLSAGKVKQNFAPLFVKAGLELDMSYGEPKQLEMIETRNSRMQHWIIELRVRLIDVDTGYGTLTQSYWGEGTDVLDKGLRKAMTAAVKSWLSDMFFLEEGIDPEISGNAEATFTPKEDPEIKSKIADAAVKPKPAKPVKEEKKEDDGNKPSEPAAEKPPVKAPRAKKAEEPTPKVAEPEKPAETPSTQQSANPATIVPGSDNNYTVTGVQEKPLEKILADWAKALGDGKISQDRYNVMATDCRAISDNRSVMQFIVKYRKVE